MILSKGFRVMVYGGVSLWILLGVYLSQGWRSSWYLYHGYTQLPQQLRQVALYGSDYQAYQFLSEQTSDTSHILMVIPDKYYQIKAAMFLYPRVLTSIANPKDLFGLPLDRFDYVYVYTPLIETSGMVHGLTGYQTKHHWNLQTLVDTHHLLRPDSSVTPESLTKQLKQQHGNMLYPL